MLEKKPKDMSQLEMISIEEFVPQDHLLRKIDKAVDFAHIYEFVKGCYSEGNGRPSIDPVVLFKLVMIQHLFGIRGPDSFRAAALLHTAGHVPFCDDRQPEAGCLCGGGP